MKAQLAPGQVDSSQFLRLSARAILCAIVLAVTLPLLAGARTAAAASADASTRRDFVDWVAACDLVVEGRIVEVRERHPPGSTSGPPATDYTLHIRRVLLGTAASHTVSVSSLTSQVVVPPGVLVAPGQRVIAYGDRIPEDRWRVWGGIVFVQGDSSLWAEGLSTREWSVNGVPLDSSAAFAALTSGLGRRRGDAEAGGIERAVALALIRLGRYQKQGPHEIVYACDSLGWAFGRAEAVPRLVDFIVPPDCTPDFGPGRTMLLPVQEHAPRDSVAVTACPHGWVVENGYVRGLGVPLAEVSRALEMRDGLVHVREFLAPNLPRGK